MVDVTGVLSLVLEGLFWFKELVFGVLLWLFREYTHFGVGVVAFLVVRYFLKALYANLVNKIYFFVIAGLVILFAVFFFYAVSGVAGPPVLDGGVSSSTSSVGFLLNVSNTTTLT